MSRPGAAGAGAVPGLLRAIGWSGFPESRGGFGAPRLWAAAGALTVTVLTAAGWFFEPLMDLLVLGPFIAAMGSGPVATAWIGAGSVLGTVLLGIPNRIWLSNAHWSEIVEALLTGMVAVLIASVRRRGERALRESEERFRALVENTAEGILILDGLGRIAYASPAAARILGRSAEEITGLDGLALVHREDRGIAEKAARGCREKPGEAVEAAFRARHRDGWWRQMKAIAVNRLSDPAIRGVVVNFRDVTESDWMERALRNSDLFNREIVSSAGEGVVVYDRSLVYLVWNRFMETLTGIPAGEVIGRPVFELFPRLREQGVERLMLRALGGETVSADVEYRFPKSGKSGWVSNTYGPHRSAEGEIVGVIGIVRDISERKRSEEAVRENERRFRAVFEGAGDALLILDDEALLVDVNAAACELYGRAREDLVGRPMADLRTSAYDFRGKWTEFLRVGHARDEIRVPRPDGTVRDVEFTATARFLPGRHLTIQRDVTERRRAERRSHVFSDLGLRLSSAQTAAEAARVISGCAGELWHWDACTVDLYSGDSDRVAPLLAVDTFADARRDVAPTRAGAPPTPRQRRLLDHGAELILREPPFSESDSVRFGDEKRLSASIMAVPICRLSRVVGFLSVQSYSPKTYDREDLESLQALANFCGSTLARIQASERLSESERQLREAQRAGRVGSWERDLEKNTVRWSDELCRIFGLEPGGFDSTPGIFLESVLPEDRERIRAHLERSLQGLERYGCEYRVRRADGEIRVVSAHAQSVTDASGKPVRVIGTAQDVTEQRRAEERLRRSSEELRALSQRLGAVREEESTRIARDLHDEVGQALTALKLDLSWVGKRIGRAGRDEDTVMQPKLTAMEGLIDTTIDAVQRIATELRPGVLHELGLDAAVGWYAREFQKRTEIVSHFHSDFAGVRLDDSRSTAVFRILQEILTNVARHAGATEVEISLGRENGTLVLEARDNGKGIPEDRISDSHSLGLVGMRERARSFGGSVTIRGRSGGGTAVTVEIPL